MGHSRPHFAIFTAIPIPNVKNGHPVFGARIRTQDLLNMSLFYTTKAPAQMLSP